MSDQPPLCTECGEPCMDAGPGLGWQCVSDKHRDDWRKMLLPLTNPCGHEVLFKRTPIGTYEQLDQCLLCTLKEANQHSIQLQQRLDDTLDALADADEAVRDLVNSQGIGLGHNHD